MFKMVLNNMTGKVERVLTNDYYLDEGGSIRRRKPKVRGKRARHIDKINRFNSKG